MQECREGLVYWGETKVYTGKQQKQGSKETAEQGDFVVDLESMGALLKKKSLRDKAAKKKAAKKKQEESMEKTTK